MPAQKYHIDIDSFIGYPISKGYVRSKLAAAGSGNVLVRVNSYGGDVQTALDIRQQFIDHGNVTVCIYGMTASAATILAMGAKKICMSKYALMLVHQCSAGVDSLGYFNKEEMADMIEKIRKQQDDLATLDNVVASIYADRAGTQDIDSIAKVMKDAKWLTADECKALGLIDEIIEEDNKQQPQVTAQLKEHFAACGLPLPTMELLPSAEVESDTKELAQNANKSFFAAIIDCIKKTLNNENTNEQNETVTMADNMITPANICAALNVENLSATEEGIVTFTAEQLQSIEDALNAAAETRETLNARIAELEADVQNLNNADGAEEVHVDTTTEEKDEYIAGAEAADFFAKFKDII